MSLVNLEGCQRLQSTIVMCQTLRDEFPSGGLIYHAPIGARVAEPRVRQGKLEVLNVEALRPPGQSTIAWRSGEKGRALNWWIERLTQPSFVEAVFS